MLCYSVHTCVPSYPAAVSICVYICEELKIRSILLLIILHKIDLKRLSFGSHCERPSRLQSSRSRLVASLNIEVWNYLESVRTGRFRD